MPTKLRLTIGTNVKHYRKACGMSTRSAAEHCGIRPNTWNSIERGLVDCRLSTLEAMAYTLNCSLISLLVKNTENDKS